MSLWGRGVQVPLSGRETGVPASDTAPPQVESTAKLTWSDSHLFMCIGVMARRGKVSR